MKAALGLHPSTFAHVRYLLRRGSTGAPNRFAPIPPEPRIYAYDLKGTIDKPDLPLSNVADPSGTIEGIYSVINERHRRE